MSTTFPPSSPSLPSSFHRDSLTTSTSTSSSSAVPPRRTSTTTGPTTSRNPISLRLYKVLASSFDDPSSREALETVSDFYVGGQGSKSIHSEGAGAGSLSTGEDGAAERARRFLRRDGEEKLAEGSRKFLAAFGDVDKKLDTLQLHMQEMHTRCDDVQSKLEEANSGTKFLLERAEGLRNQRTSTRLRSTLIELFLSRFTLAQSELETLTSRDVPVGLPLFAAMDRVKGIRKDCRALLGGDEGGTTAGLDIMAATSQQLDLGYQKIFRWIQFEFRQFVREAQLEVGVVLREAVKRLRDRKSLLTEALSTLSHLRSTSLLSLFLDALTRGGPSGLPRPIELHAHDPQRYVGDMLAWVHQATAGEREFLESLFGAKAVDGRMVGSMRRKGEGEEEELVREMLDRDMEGCCRPLRIRIQHTIKSQDGVIMSYKIVNLLQFYLVTMKRTIGEDALLSRTLQEIHDVSYKAFFDTLDAKGRSLLRFLHPPDSDLSPPLALRDSVQTLREIMSVYESTLIGVADDPRVEGDFARILDAAVDPPLEMCRRMADLRKGEGGEWEKAVFLANCVGYLEHVLESYSFTATRVLALKKQLDCYVKLLADEHYSEIVEQSGLAPLLRALHEKDDSTPLAHLPLSNPSNLPKVLQSFEAYLTTLDVLSSPRLSLIYSPALGRAIHRNALERLAAGYVEIWEAVMDKEKNKYEFPSSLLIRGKEEVRVLLGIEEEEEEGGEGEGKKEKEEKVVMGAVVGEKVEN
ncbi:oligomeric Golgi complex subunit 6 [Mrakia frigida]|uniref:Golgi transport complex subunit COG6 n=1 Tax=Mrakia frigida TaxID=29902 RepID=UPI003FCC0BE8